MYPLKSYWTSFVHERSYVQIILQAPCMAPEYNGKIDTDPSDWYCTMVSCINAGWYFELMTFVQGYWYCAIVSCINAGGWLEFMTFVQDYSVYSDGLRYIRWFLTRVQTLPRAQKYQQIPRDSIARSSWASIFWTCTLWITPMTKKSSEHACYMYIIHFSIADTKINICNQAEIENVNIWNRIPLAMLRKIMW